MIFTKQGPVEGKELSCATLYAGVPYARAARFCAPAAPETHTDVLRAERFGAACPQAFMPEGSFYDREFYFDHAALPTLSEDCLTLNIWVPHGAQGKALPVAMWIHGGAFDHGWSFETEFDGEAFARDGVILVTVNYRVGVFGFFAHPELDACNFGLLDQIAALTWLHENIAAFGGNPENITVFGQSAGAMSTQLLVSSPLTKNMIAKAIFQSGGGVGAGLNPGRSLEEGRAICLRFMEENNLADLDAVRAVPTDALLNMATAFAERHEAEYRLSFMPLVDGVVTAASVDELARSGGVKDIPYMLGSTKDDLAAEGGRRLLQEACEAWAKTVSSPCFVYDFSHDLPGDDAGAFHSSELWYVFGTYPRSQRPMTAADAALSRAMTRAWAGFMTLGNPGWPSFTANQPFVQLFA